VTAVYHTPSDATLPLGVALATPTYTQIPAQPYVRYQAQLASQAEYGGMVSFFIGQGTRNNFTVQATSGYFDGTPATWDLSVPDFSTVAGWDPTWGLETGLLTTLRTTAWTTPAMTGKADRLMWNAGAVVKQATHASSVTPN
jgi:hypothetical protein